MTGLEYPFTRAPARHRLLGVETTVKVRPAGWFHVSSCETHRDEARIWQAGGQAEPHIWPGAFHGFDMLAQAALSKAAATARRGWLHRLLADQH